MIVVFHSGIDDLHSLLDSTDSVAVRVAIVDVSPEQLATHDPLVITRGATVLAAAANLGYGWACNLGARHCIEQGAEVLIFSNPDVIFLNSSIQQLEVAAQGGGVWAPIQSDTNEIPLLNSVLPSPSLRASVARWLVVGRTCVTRQRSDVLDASLGATDSRRFSRSSCISGACVAMSRGTFDLVRGWSTDYFLFEEDIDLSLRCHNLGIPIGLVPSARVIHMGGFNNRPATRASLAIQRASELTLWKTHHVGPPVLLRVIQSTGTVARRMARAV